MNSMDMHVLHISKQLRSHEKHIFTNEVYDSENARYKDSVVQFDCAYVIPIAHINIFIKNWMNIVSAKLPENYKPMPIFVEKLY